MSTDSSPPECPSSACASSTVIASIAGWGGWLWAMAFAIAMLSLPMFLNSGPNIRWDWPAWWSVTHAMHSDIVPHQKWFWGVVWTDGNASLILGRNYSVAIILPWLLSYVVSVTVAQKILFLLTMEMTALAGYAFARSFASRFMATLAGLLILGRTASIISGGMWYDVLAIAGALLFCRLILQFVEVRQTRYWAMSCLAMAFTFYCHPLGAIMALSAWLGLLPYVLGSRTTRRLPVLVALGVIPLIGLLLAAPQVFTLFEFASHGTAKPASIPGLFVPSHKDIVRLSALVMSLPGLCFLWTCRRAFFWMVFTMMITGIAIYLRLPAWMPDYFPFRSGLLVYSGRFLLVTDALTVTLCLATFYWVNDRMLPARALKARISESGTRSSGKAARTVSPERILDILAQIGYHPLGRLAIVTFALLLFGTAIARVYTHIPHDTLRTTGLHHDFEDLCGWLRLNVVKDDCRVYVEDTLCFVGPGTLPQAKDTHLFGLLAAQVPLQQVNGFWTGDSPFSKHYTDNGGSILKCPIATLDESQIQRDLCRLNCKYLVACSREGRRSLGECEFLVQVASFGQFAVFRVTDFVSCWGWNDDDTQRPLNVVKVSPTEYHVDTGTATDVVVSLAYAHRWKAYSGGRELPVKEAHGLISIPLERPLTETVILRYEIQRYPAIVGASVGVVMYLAFITFFGMRRRRATGR
jgi:hypothetical protein